MDKEEMMVLLNKCWMSHDGMWFFHCCQEFGIEVANRLNHSAIASLAPLEITRFKKALGYDGVDIKAFDQFQDFFSRAAKLVIPDFMGGRFFFGENNTLTMEMKPQQCFAYKGMQRIGVIAQYECGVHYRIDCWIKALGIDYQKNPNTRHCSMHTEGTCLRRFVLSFDS